MLKLKTWHVYLLCDGRLYFLLDSRKKDKIGNIIDKKEHSNIDEHLNKQYQVSLKLHFCHLIFCTFVLTVVYMIYENFHTNIPIISINFMRNFKS